MENVTSVLKSADGPTSIFVAGKTPEIMGALIATVVVGVIIALFGLKIVRVLSALVGLAVGAVIGATVGVIAGFDMTKMLVAVAVCAVILCVMCAALRKFGIFIMTFFVIPHTNGNAIPASTPPMMPVTNITKNSAKITVSIATIRAITAQIASTITDFVSSSVTNVPKDPKIGWIGYVMSAAIAVIGIVVQTMMQSRKIGKKEKIFSKKIKEQVSMESEVEKARMLLDDGEPEESMEAAGNKEKTDNAEDTDKEETVTEIFDLDDTKPDEDNLDDDEDVVTVEKTDEPEDGFLDEDDVEIFETDDSDVVVFHPDDID